MIRIDRQTTLDLVKLVVFIIATSIATGMLVIVIGNLSLEKTNEYRAVFSDVTGVVTGDDIRIAGVKVGSVTKVDIIERNKAQVTFSVRRSVPLTRSSSATIRYRNLIGQRYIVLTEGVGDTTRLPAGSTIPLERTQPALDLTVLFNGFKPLFAALSPAEINKLSYELITVFQGEGGNIANLLHSTGSVTQTLAGRDQLIGEVIANLNAVLETIGGRDRQLTALIIQLRAFMAGLVEDKDVILASLDSVSALAEETSTLTTTLRPDLVATIKGLRRLAKNLDDNTDELDRVLQILPVKLEKIGRTAVYGSFFNFFICEFTARVNLPPPIGEQHITYKTFPLGNGRCNLA